MNIKQKYDFIYPQIDNGDIFLVRGTSFLANCIKWGDRKDGENAYWTHAGVIRKVAGRRYVAFKTDDELIALQSLAHGVEAGFLSTEIYSNVDFCIIKPLFPQEIKDKAVDDFFKQGEQGIPYDYWMLPKVLASRKMGITVSEDKGKNICSVSAAWTYGGKLPIKCYSKENVKEAFITPQDLIRFADHNEIAIIGNDI